jgi:hypothetical protein
MAIPLLDAASLIFSRSLRGHYPFRADRDHIHHILQRAGLSDGQVAMAVIVLSFLVGGIGVTAWVSGVPEWCCWLDFCFDLVRIFTLSITHAKWCAGFAASQPHCVIYNLFVKTHRSCFSWPLDFSVPSPFSIHYH